MRFLSKTNLKQSLYINRKVAYRMFLKLRTNFENYPRLSTEYKAVTDNYLEENIIEPAEDTSDVNAFYMRRRAVIHDDKLISRVRIVFHGSAYTNREVSLNNRLYTGNNFKPDLF